MKIEFLRHNIDEQDIARANDVMRSIFLTNSKVTQAFETKFAEYLGHPYAVAVNSGTSALHLALVALGIGPGDEVITTPMSFVATANAIVYSGATPVFVDVEKDTGNMDITKVEEKINRRTKAIIPVHLYGNMVNMRALKRLADIYSLRIIEDACQCIEGIRDGIRVGQLADVACFSFHATKNISAGEGGAIVCHDERLARRFKVLRAHGVDKDAGNRYSDKHKHYEMQELGWKYNPTDIQSALLIGQLARIDDLLVRREKLARRYEEAFRQCGIRMMHVPADSRSARHLFTILLDNRDDAVIALHENEIGVAVNYRPIHLHPYYQNQFGYKAGQFPAAEFIGERTLSLPLYPRLTEDEQDLVIKAVKEIL